MYSEVSALLALRQPKEAIGIVQKVNTKEKAGAAIFLWLHIN